MLKIILKGVTLTVGKKVLDLFCKIGYDSIVKRRKDVQPKRVQEVEQEI